MIHPITKHVRGISDNGSVPNTDDTNCLVSSWCWPLQCEHERWGATPTANYSTLRNFKVASLLHLTVGMMNTARAHTSVWVPIWYVLKLVIFKSVGNVGLVTGQHGLVLYSCGVVPPPFQNWLVVVILVGTSSMRIPMRTHVNIQHRGRVLRTSRWELFHEFLAWSPGGSTHTNTYNISWCIQHHGW